MKNVLILLVVIAMVMVGSSVQSVSIVGSSHDLSTGGAMADKSLNEDKPEITETSLM